MRTIFDTNRVKKEYKGFSVVGVIRPRTLPSTWIAYKDVEENFLATSEARLKEMINGSLKCTK